MSSVEPGVGREPERPSHSVVAYALGRALSAGAVRVVRGVRREVRLRPDGEEVLTEEHLWIEEPIWKEN